MGLRSTTKRPKYARKTGVPQGSVLPIAKYHKYITNIPQIYHESTTKCDIVPQKEVLLQNVIFYHIVWYFS